MDTLHIHKLMGFGCLLHYGVRFYYRLQYGNMFFNYYDITPFVHLGLSLSSFLFKVPTYKLNTKAIIWKELQLHNIIFTSRSVMMMYHSIFFKEVNFIYYLIRLGIISFHHYLADLVTDKYQNNNKITTRDIPHDIENKKIVDANKKFYAVSQIVASTNLLLSNKPDNAFGIMFPIQFSTFLMTLVRKGYISNNMWHLLYTISLILPYLINYNTIASGDSNTKIYLTIFHIIMRLIIKTNKYYNFLLITIAYNYYSK